MTGSAPKVTFIVPCYKLGHLLGECIESILAQTFRDFEILIMDDCSPDNTPQVAQSFKDPRVKHIRNQPNLGHLRNYNKGIEIAGGRYIWLISADDRLRSDRVLERYVRLLDMNPRVGYVFCPGMDLQDGQETGVLPYSFHGERDAIFNGRMFLAKLIVANTIVSPSVLVRRECYAITKFPLDMPWGGDWYLWCIFALHFDVAYFAEPMVCYRRHGSSMTNVLMNHGLSGCSEEDIAMPWIIKQKAEELGYRDLVEPCLNAAAQEYANLIATKRYRTTLSRMSVEDFEKSLAAKTSNLREQAFIRDRVYIASADRFCWQEEYQLARDFYRRAIRRQPLQARAWGRFLVLSLGDFGIWFRKAFLALRGLKTGSRPGTRA